MEFDFIGIVLRWMHILAAITAVGGVIFMRLALLPAVATLPESTRPDFHEAIRTRWARPVQIAILFLLLSGIFNIISVENQYDVGKVPYYRLLFGIKFLLALPVFFLASVLTGRSNFGQRFRDNRKLWLTVNVVLAVIIVCLSGILRKANPPRKPIRTSQTPAVTAPVGMFLPNSGTLIRLES
jgi:uncharacterized membrane protein